MILNMMNDYPVIFWTGAIGIPTTAMGALIYIMLLLTGKLDKKKKEIEE